MKLSLFGKKDLSKQLPSHNQEPNKTCGICFDLKIDSEIFKLTSKIFKRRKCNHLFCIDCIRKYLEIKLNDNVYKVMCPSPNCCVTFKPKHLQHILPKHCISRWEYLIFESSISMEQKNYCPYQNCSVLLEKGNDIRGKFVTNSKCPSCHRNFCAQCKVPWHEGMDCQKFQQLKWGDKYDLDIKFLELAKRKKWKRCPNCSMFVNRSRGCNDMLCRCGCHFCYRCGKKWGFHTRHKCNSS
ncbi:E3 ubiquitin-protein ligase RSL1-like [Trifolium pratense]|uniref:E3 ubiquitin-protein ligase RSL1-like n=1 Tax=Trifolium pratense TaxID=57577 RepID=UPI001E6949B1|nr:E3 ubiquitin-protein ligase RSL1-like [Trifolium pratense]